MATNNAVDVGLSGSTGTVNFVGSTSPTLVTPTLGAATATSVAFSPTTGGLIGTTVADNASAGTVGEFIQSKILQAGAITYTSSGVTQNLTSITLSAGDWDVWGNVFFIPATATVILEGISVISLVSATAPDNSLLTQMICNLANVSLGVPALMQRINVNTSTIVYMLGYSVFSISTLKMSGGIYARRVR